jgi:hypothetical protein
VACHHATFRRPAGGAAPAAQPFERRPIADNIAEGAGQQSQRQFARYLANAIASAHEVDSQPRVHALHILDPDEARKLLSGLGSEANADRVAPCGETSG